MIIIYVLIQFTGSHELWKPADFLERLKVLGGSNYGSNASASASAATSRVNETHI